MLLEEPIFPSIPEDVMGNILVLGIAGSNPGCGKDTAAEYFQKHFQFQLHTPNDGVYKVASVILQKHESWIKQNKDHWIDGLGMNVRTFLQNLGTEAGRHGLHSDLWILMCEREITRSNPDIVRYPPRIVLPSIRFENELAFIRQFPHGYLLYVSGPDWRGHETDLNHESEALNGWLRGKSDFIIRNTGSKTQLHADLASLAHTQLNLE